ncbi:MAG: hypothetical protein GX825_10535 [Syntrophomonadaceae bacterium]|nr:hypothetical protein [Syntrophomonadaceae bacterium]
MSITKDDLHKIIDQLSEKDRTSAYDYLLYLASRAKRKPLTWEEIAKLPPDTEPLSEEEKRQLDAPGEYVALDEIRHEYEV